MTGMEWWSLSYRRNEAMPFGVALWGTRTLSPGLLSTKRRRVQRRTAPRR